jgi:hypothetical protein
VAAHGEGGGAPGDWGVARGEGLGEWGSSIGAAVLGWRGVAHGDAWGSKGWQVAVPLGTGEWHVGRG